MDWWIDHQSLNRLIQKYKMTYTFGNADIRIKNGYILLNTFFFNLQISVLFHQYFSIIAFLRVFLKLKHHL